MAQNRGTILDLFRHTVAAQPDKVAITFLGKSISFREVDQQSDRVAAGLATTGVSPGDRIALYCVNSDYYAIAYLGIVKAGGVVVPINLLLTPNEITYILTNAQVKGLIYHEAFAQQVDALRHNVPSLTFFVHVGQSPRTGEIPWGTLINTEGHPPDFAINPAEDLVCLIYTSGTTGKPKGAMLTHKNLVANTTSCNIALKLNPGKEIFLVVLPMFHSFAMTVGTLLPLLHGYCLAPLPKFDPQAVADAVAQTQATLFLGVPTMYAKLLELPESETRKFASLRYCVSGGAALSPSLMDKFERRFGKPIYEGDGPTECSPVTCVNPIGGVRKAGSVGVPVANVEMSIRDATGQPVADTDLGEICVRGNNVMKGYWRHPQETAAAFFQDWYRTGDIGYRDEDGYFFIVDRLKDMIIVNGMNVYPKIVEDVIHQFNGVLEASVIGEPDEIHGEIPVAFVVPTPGADLHGEAITAFCAQHLGKYQVPRKVIIVEALPRTPTGKILKRELRKHGEHERGIKRA